MSTPTLTHLVSAQSVATVTSLASGSVTITAGRPAMAIVFSGALNSDDNTTPPSFSGAGQTWTQLLTTTDVFADTGYNDYMRVSLFVTDASSGGSGVVTATHPPGEQQDILAFAVFELTDGSFASPEPLAKGNNATSMTDVLAGVAAGDRYAALCLWTSFYTSSPGGFTARSGWTEVTQVIAADAGYGLAFQLQLSPVGGDATASFSVSNTGQLALIAIPLEAATAGGTTWSAAAHIVSGSACAGSLRMIRARTAAAAAGSTVLRSPRLVQVRGVSVQGAASLSMTIPRVMRRYTVAVTGGATLAIAARTVRTRSVTVAARAVLSANANVAGTLARSTVCTAQSSVGVSARVVRARAVSAGGFSTVTASARVAGKLTRGAAVGAASSIVLSAQVTRRRSAAIGTQTAVLATGTISGKLSARSASTAGSMVTVQLRVIRNRRSAAGASGTANADPRIRRPRRAGVTAASALVLTRRVLLARAANAEAASLVAVRVWMSGLSARRQALPRASANGGVVAPSERRGRVQPHLRNGSLR